MVSALIGTKGVRAAICALTDLGGRPGITAFVETSQPLPPAEALEAARHHLPANAMPDEVFVLSTFPLTSQGKVDRTRLLAAASRSPWRDN